MHEIARPVHLQCFDKRIAMLSHIGVRSRPTSLPISAAMQLLVIENNVSRKRPVHRLAPHILSIRQVAFWVLVRNGAPTRLPATSLDVEEDPTERAEH